MSSMASTGADRGHGQWAPVCPRAAPHLLQTLQPAPRLRRFPGLPTWGDGEVPGACQLGSHRSRWLGLLSCLAPTPMPSVVPALGPSTSLHFFTRISLPTSPTQTSTSVRRMALSVGPARCALTPAAATSVWTRHVRPPTVKAPAQGKG